jgi:type II secretory pathway pseudopilin PulG
LIEAMIAMIILLLVVLSTLSVVPFGFNSVATNAVHVQAVAVGQQFLDDERNAMLQNLPPPTATTVPIDPGESFVSNGQPNINYGNFEVTPNGCATVESGGTAISAVNTFTCSVTVSWTESGAPRSVVVQSYVTAAQ